MRSQFPYPYNLNEDSGSLTLNYLEVRKHLQVEGPIYSKTGVVEINSLLQTQGSTTLFNADFKTGTYRIQRGGTYKLGSNIVFDPLYGQASKRKDTPINGFWFAGISIETSDPVVIDGQGYTFSVSPSYIAANAIGTFAVILLGNGQFAGSLFNGAGARYADATSFVAANNVTLNNLIIQGNSSHFGIMCNNNTDVKMSNCQISDCQVACLYAQSPQNMILQNTKLLGSTTPITVTMDQTQLILMRQQYAQLIANGVPGASSQLALLEAYVATNPTRFDPAYVTPQALPSSFYGMFIVPGTTALFPFPMTKALSAISASFVDGFYNGYFGNNITIDNCEIADCNSLFNELVVIGSNIPKSPLFPLSTWPLILFGLFGAIQWKDAYNGVVFQPNEFLRSIVFIMNYLWTLPAPLPFGILPANSLAIFNAILTKPVSPASTALFNANAAPLMSNQSDATLAKGLFGMRICGANNVQISNTTFKNIQSTQTTLPIDQTTLPGYGSLTAPQPVFISAGNDTWAVSLEGCNNVTIDNCSIKNVTSARGDVFGIHAAGDDSNIQVTNCDMDGLSAPNTVVANGIVAADTYGVRIDTPSGPTLVQNCTTRNLSAGGDVEPFTTPAPVPTTVNGNQSLTTTPFTLTVVSTAGFPESGLLLVTTTDASPNKIVQYADLTPTTFNDCVATGSFTTLNGSNVSNIGLVTTNCLEF